MHLTGLNVIGSNVITAKALQGSIVQVVDDNGDTWNNIVILEVTKAGQREVGVSAPNDGTGAIVVFNIRVVNASTTF